MSARLLHEQPLKEVRRAVRRSKRPALAAVAYFGKHGGTLLPLKRGSRLVVDASEHAVKSGQTHPNSLLALQQAGVRVYSASHLHAKVVVVGNRAFVGSANVSRRSESVLLEAVLETTAPAAVREAREFIRDLCLEPLGPERLRELQAVYQPPRLVGGSGPSKRGARFSGRRTLSRMWLVNLVRADWTEEEQRVHDSGLETARSRRQHARTWTLDSFRWHSRAPYLKGDRVVQLVRERDGRTMIHPPGVVLDARRFELGRTRKSFVYLELPPVRRKSLNLLARQIGYGAKKRLMRGGRVGVGPFLDGLLRAFDE